MRFATSIVFGLALLVRPEYVYSESSAEIEILRTMVRQGGVVSAAALYRNEDEKLSEIGRVVFESNAMSLNGRISCKTCHLERFGSADGIPVAAAIGGGDKEGPARALSNAKFLSRNTLALWGSGGNGFKNFFWDGRVEFSDKRKVSPFGSNVPSSDMLEVVVHLPAVEIREMLDEDAFIRLSKKENVSGSTAVFDAIARNLKKREAAASAKLAAELDKSVEKLVFLDYARAVAAHIRKEFRIKSTPLERFLGGQSALTKEQVRGGLVFYGKGGCVTCHSGPYFSDFEFHVVPFPQLGFGKSGFGIDYGRYGATFDPRDLYKFRTPPLLNVQKTGPYGHSGSVATLEEAIVAHFDPLRLVNQKSMDPLSRHDLFRRMALASETATRVGFMSNQEVSDVATFLKSLSF